LGGTSWILDSDCTNHMTKERKMFTSFQLNHDSSENIVFGNNGKQEVLWLGKTIILNDNSISNVIFGTFIELRFAKWLIVVSSWMRV
jgi:hypothetical protein